MYECETRSLSLREEHKLRVFENVVVRRMFGSNRKEVAGGWRRLHNKDLCNLYTLPHITKRMRFVGHVECSGVHTKFWSENLTERDHTGDLRIHRMVVW
jgi:hypothetical protein